MKKIISLTLILIMLLSPTVYSVGADLEKTADYLKTSVKNPKVGSIGGEWIITGLSRYGMDVGDEYFQNYYSNLCDYVNACKGVLHNRKYTEYSRVIIAVRAIGRNPENVEGYNLVSNLYDYDKTVIQGVNGAIWALIALDSGNYGNDEIRNKYLTHILDREKEGGGWALSDKAAEADVDITAMALTALSPYSDEDRIKAVIERGLLFLSSVQNENGGYSAYNTEASESSAQVLLALSALGISSEDSRFVKNGYSLKDNILSYLNDDGSFSHNGEKNMMATEQCFYALVAEKRMTEGKSDLFDMSDVKINESESGEENKIKIPDIKYPGKTFSDIRNHKNKNAVEKLGERGIINGKTEDIFDPDATMTRAEFATITVNSLKLFSDKKAGFTDVKESDWFYDYINRAYAFGIIKGVSEKNFNPYGIITRQEAAVMISRAAELCGLENDYNTSYSKDILCVFNDYTKVSDWAFSQMAFCYGEKILSDEVLKINPDEPVTRGEIAQMFYNLFIRARLLEE